MTKEEFCHLKEIDKAKHLFVDKGWITLYQSNYDKSDVVNSSLTYCYFVSDSFYESCLSKHQSDIDRSEKSDITGENFTYKPFSKDGFEPLICYKLFNLKNGNESYIDISEELVGYLNLYEEIKSKQDRTYYYIEQGEKEEVIKVTEKEVTIKQKYLIEYLAIRKMNLVLWFNFETIAKYDKINCKDIKISDSDKGTNDIGDNYCINSLIRLVFCELQSCQEGKVILRHKNIEDIGCHYYRGQQNVDFIVDYDNETGKDIELSCERVNENLFKVTIFRKEVLDKYYNDSTNYKVDGFHVTNKFFTLKIDNNNENYVAVLLVELSNLPYKEQLYWKSFNISPNSDMKFSNSYKKVMFEGCWNNESETADLFFKDKYKDFTKKWKNKFGWDLFKPLHENQKYAFESLHIISKNNNIDDFCKQILSLTLILIDSINDKELSTKIDYEEKDKSIGKLEKYIISFGYDETELITFLRRLQDLRSGITTAHRFSDRKSRTAKKAIKFFNINNDFSNLIEVSNRIFRDCIHTLNTLERYFLSE